MTKMKIGRPSDKQRLIESVTREKEGVVRVSFDVSLEQHIKVKKWAIDHGMSLKEAGRKALLELVSK